MHVAIVKNDYYDFDYLLSINTPPPPCYIQYCYTLPYLELSVPFVHFLLTMRECTVDWSPTGGPSITKFHSSNVCWKVPWKWSDCSLSDDGVEFPRRHAFAVPRHRTVDHWLQEPINRSLQSAVS